MCAPWFYPSWWLLSWAAGWATGWQMGAARAKSSLLPAHTLRIRTPLLRLSVSTLRLNPSAEPRRPYAMKGGHLRLVSHD